MRLKINRMPAMASCCLGFALGVALLAMLTLPGYSRLHTQYLQTYGNALAAMAANQAIEASFNNDLIGLQAILQEVMKNPNTLLATIHDVENHLQVQAGDSRALEQSKSLSFTTPIVLHSSITGYLSVHLKQADSASPVPVWLVILSCLLMVSVAIWQLVATDSFELIDTPLESGSKSSNDGEPVTYENSSDDSETHDNSVQEIPLVYAIIHIKNLAVLQQQLNGENFRKTLSTVDQIISDVLALYNGAGYSFNNDQFQLRFYAIDATNEALFRAACSAWLIVELASIVENIPLDLAAFVSANHLDLAPANLPIAGLVIENQAAADELISRRLNFLEVGSEDGRKVVAGFEQPFKSLLEKQRAQLAELS